MELQVQDDSFYLQQFYSQDVEETKNKKHKTKLNHWNCLHPLNNNNNKKKHLKHEIQ